ncbi:acyltransferase family protein [Rhodococcus chondri]|uniref:Acyltransferase family protein n=1 Tax=Rhodococcus chondri TaxID=3065941 RepID=A0ABU7JWL1_9NOCA|nr:acyltransferase family protein [Rhodococcus sp. CC-R104]MEE2034397.1 acyltransferase family protein [Rhodococcus sp. CC-R104]
MSVHTSPPDLASSSSATTARPGYRVDLDGLRGLAIALVVVFHVWFGRVSGGVDVFLALSGFFFIGSLLRVGESPAPLDPRPVLRRIARRLLPPLVLVLAATTVAALIVLPSPQWFRVAEQTRASLTFVQNWHLARTASDYLAADPMVSPLQHLWSIAVQGQFYILALVVVFTSTWLLRRFSLPVRGPLAVLLAVVTVASLFYASTAAQTQSWLYYDSAARMWELTIGGVLACVAPWLRVPGPVRVALGIAGLAVLLGCGFVLDGGAQFPGPWALVPVGAAMVLVVSGSTSGTDAPDTPTATLLSTPPLIRLGSIAYSLYLWHWPVLIGYLVVRQRTELGLLGGLGVIALSLVLAEATTRWIENPIRRQVPGRGRTTLVACLGVIGVSLAALATTWLAHVDHTADVLAHTDDLPADLYPGAAALAPFIDVVPRPVFPPLLAAHLDLPSATLEGCIVHDREPRMCTYGDALSTRRMALVGGSHSEHWLTALDVLGKQHGFRVDTYLKVGCPLSARPAPLDEDSPTAECDTWSAGVLAALAADPPDYVFTTSTRPKAREDGPGDHTPSWYVELWETLADYGIDVIAIRDTPWLERDGVPFNAVDCLDAGGTPDSCAVPRAEMLEPIDPSEAASAHLPSVLPVDLSDSLCRRDVCRVVEGNVVVYRDDDHLTATYVRTLAPDLGRRLAAITNWW